MIQITYNPAISRSSQHLHNLTTSLTTLNKLSNNWDIPFINSSINFKLSKLYVLLYYLQNFLIHIWVKYHYA